MKTTSAAGRHGSAILLLLLLSLPASQTALAQSAGGVSKIRIENFGQISPTYFRGAQPEGRDYRDLAALGVRTVINLTSDDAQADEGTLVQQAGMTYIQIPMTTHRVPTPAELATFLGIVNDPAQQPVYVHCVGGKHRTGVMTAVYRMSQFDWTAQRAYDEMKKFKFGASFLHPEFKTFVFAYPAMQASAGAAAEAKAAPKGGGR